MRTGDFLEGDYIILIHEPGLDAQWERLDEGPWSTYDAAETFARSEMGVPWMIVRIESLEGVPQ